MTNQDYEAKKRECWEEYCQAPGTVFRGPAAYGIFSAAYDRAYVLGKEKEKITREDVEKEAEKYAINVNDKRLSAYPEQFRSQLSPEYDVTDLVDAFAAGVTFALGKQEKDAETVISGWGARDKDGLLNFFYGGSVPYRNENDGDWNTLCGRVLEWLPKDLFPDLTWESDPLEVELIIKRKKKNL